jgi:hypothetical protein
VSEYQCLVGSHFTKRKYQRLSYVVNLLVPVRCPLDNLIGGRVESTIPATANAV